MPLPNRIVNSGLWVLPQLHPGHTDQVVPASALCPAGEIMPCYDCAFCCFSVSLGGAIVTGTVTITIKHETNNTILAQETLSASARKSYAFTYDPQIDIGTGSIIKCYVTTSADLNAGFVSMSITPGFSF